MEATSATDTDVAMDGCPDTEEQKAPPTFATNLRRSSRRKKSITIQSDSPQHDSESPSTTGEPRRNPKRKASEGQAHIREYPDSLLDEALAPLTATDIQEWEGWVELESEPAFFNIILQDLGVQDVKAQEMFSLDQDSLAMLPKPVFGLIFLYKYHPEIEEINEEVDTSNVWFANQTTDNACATVALLNIVMNAEEIELGEKLKEFKESTKDLSTALRGHRLSRNAFIRQIHNSFTRRMDHLNADLALENEVTDAKSNQPRKRAAPKKTKKGSEKKKKKKRVRADYGYHFVAYVPASGYVWELDGLSRVPHRLGPLPDSDWTNVAQPQIEARMMQSGDSPLSFNLLALCRCPLGTFSRNIATALSSLRLLHSTMEENATFKELVSADPNPLDTSECQLAEFNIKMSDIHNAEVPEALREKISQLGGDTNGAYALYQELTVDAKSAIGEYRSELMAIADGEQRVKGRKKDYGQALHKWVKKLAEKGVLEDVIKNT